MGRGSATPPVFTELATTVAVPLVAGAVLLAALLGALLEAVPGAALELVTVTAARVEVAGLELLIAGEELLDDGSLVIVTVIEVGLLATVAVSASATSPPRPPVRCTLRWTARARRPRPQSIPQRLP